MKRSQEFSKIKDCDIDPTSVIYDQVNLYRCKIGRNTKVDAFVYIEEGVVIGENCKIRPFVFLPSGVVIGNNVFIGPNVTFTNDRYPDIGENWKMENTIVEDTVSIGAGSVILPGVRIGKHSLIGSGSVVTHDIPPNSIYYNQIQRKIKPRVTK